MPNKRIIFILGAGSSKEVNLPVGIELRDQIARLLNIRYEHSVTRISGDEKIVEAFQFKARSEGDSRCDINPYLHEGWKIVAGMPQAASIDNYLDVHSDNKRLVYCGKLAIVRSILTAEQNSLLYFNGRTEPRQITFKNIENTWFSQFWHKLTENCNADNLRSRFSRIAFINFNYDRCLEHFLHCSLQNYYHLTYQDASEILSTLQIFHPYGKVGYMPWENAEPKVGFGSEVHPATLNNMASEIKTFTEGTDPTTSDISTIRNFVADAQIIAFLGFAFHRINLKLIFPELEPDIGTRQIDLFGSAKGLSYSDLRAIVNELAVGFRMPEDRISLDSNLECRKLFSEFGRSISLVA